MKYCCKLEFDCVWGCEFVFFGVVLCDDGSGLFLLSLEVDSYFEVCFVGVLFFKNIL